MTQLVLTLWYHLDYSWSICMTMSGRDWFNVFACERNKETWSNVKMCPRQVATRPIMFGTKRNWWNFFCLQLSNVTTRSINTGPNWYACYISFADLSLWFTCYIMWSVCTDAWLSIILSFGFVYIKFQINKIQSNKIPVI